MAVAIRYISIYTSVMFLLRVINALEAHKVRYALVGGYAVSLHGAIRGTVDIDLVITLSSTSYRNAEKALNSIGLQSRLPVTAEDVFQFRNEYIKNRNMVAWAFVNPDNPIEMVDILITEDARDIKVTHRTAINKKLKVASIEDLIRIKRKSARPQDIEDIRALEKLKP